MPKPRSLTTTASTSTFASRNAREYHLWQAFREGDSYALEQLLELYYPLLLNYGTRLSKDREFVKDCLHDLFVELWNRKDRLNEIENPKPYLFLSFRRKLIRETNKIRWFREAHEVADDYALEVQFTIESYLISKEVQHEALKKLKGNIEKLTKRQREVIYLRFYQELEYDEIAGIMEINYHSVVNLIYEALRMLRKNWFLTLLGYAFISPF